MKKIIDTQRTNLLATSHSSKLKLAMDLPLWVVACVFIATTFIFFMSQLLGSSFFWEDFVRAVYPSQAFAAREWLADGIPFWNPYTFNGSPFFADVQIGFFYPFNRLMSLFVASDGTLPVAAVQSIIILHFFISQFGLYLLSRSFKISSIGSIIAAISYSFSMLMICHVFHPMMIYHLAWFPWVVWLFYRALHQQKIKYGILAGLIFGMSLLAGHPQTALYEAFFLLLFFIVYSLHSLAKKEWNAMALVWSIIRVAVPMLIAVGIFAVQYLPSAELADLSQRDEITFEKASEGSLQLKQVYSTISPKIFGTVSGSTDKSTYYLQFKNNSQSYFFWETSFYFGLAALLLGIIGIAAFANTKLGITLIILMIFCFFICFRRQWTHLCAVLSFATIWFFSNARQNAVLFDFRNEYFRRIWL